MKTLRNKMLVLLIASTFTLFTLAFGIIGYRIMSVLNDYAYRNASQYAQEGAASAGKNLQESVGMLKETASVVEILKQEGRTDRDILPPILHGFLTNNSSVFSLWVLFEPNAWDGQDARFANTGDYDKLGNYAVWAYRNQSDQVEVTTEAWGKEAYSEDYYTGPKNTRGLWVSKPYDEEIRTGYTVQMISIGQALYDASGNIIGVAGIDFSMDTLNSILGTIDSKSGGSSSIATHEGLLLADTLFSAAGTYLSDSQSTDTVSAASEAANADSSLPTASSHTETEINGETILQMIEPIKFADSVDPWTFIVSLPRKQILAVPIRIYIGLVIAELAVLLTLTVIIVVIANRVSRPLVNLTKTFAVIASGDLRPEITIKTKDETRRLADGFNQLTGTLSRLLGQSKSAMGQLMTNASRLSEEMGKTDQAFSRTADSVTNVIMRGSDINRGVKETTASIGKITESITSLETRSRGESELILQSVSAIEEMLASIKSVTEIVVQASEHYSKLNESSALGEELLNDVIGKVQNIHNQSESLLETNTVIANIASQTNLLSMNAAIEAAHAGDAGKGFAVVADEIRKLSESTSDQSKEVEKILNSIVGLIRSIAESSREAGANFSQIRTLIEIITRLEQEVKLSMEEQSAGSNQILSSLDEMKTASTEIDRESTSVSEQVKKIAEEVDGLNRNSEDIQNSIGEVYSSNEAIRKAVESAVELTRNNNVSIERVNESLKVFHLKEETDE